MTKFSGTKPVPPRSNPIPIPSVPAYPNPNRSNSSVEQLTQHVYQQARPVPKPQEPLRPAPPPQFLPISPPAQTPSIASPSSLPPRPQAPTLPSPNASPPSFSFEDILSPRKSAAADQEVTEILAQKNPPSSPRFLLPPQSNGNKTATSQTNSSSPSQSFNDLVLSPVVSPNSSNKLPAPNPSNSSDTNQK